MLACDRDARILAVGKGVFELTGFQEGELIGKDLREALTLRSPDGEDPVATVLEWGVRKLDQTLELQAPRRHRQARARRPLSRLRRGRRPARLPRAARQRAPTTTTETRSAAPAPHDCRVRS